MFDRVYNLGGVLSESLKGIQTVSVPPGGAVITEFKLDLVGILHVEGAANPAIFDGEIMPGGGH